VPDVPFDGFDWAGREAV